MSNNFDTPEAAYAEAERRIEEAYRSKSARFQIGFLPLETLPLNIAQMVDLTELAIHDCNLQEIPESIGDLCYLYKVDLSVNSLTHLPKSIGNLSQLKEIYLQDNLLVELPDSIGHLTQLQELVISSNQLTKLPESLGQMAELQELYVSDNQLIELPESIGQLQCLQVFTVDANNLMELPESLLMLAEAGTLHTLYLHDNPLLGIPPEILGPDWMETEEEGVEPQDPKRIARYWRQVMAGLVRPLNEAKVLVVGPGGHGKSSLIEFLRHGTFELGKEPTEGVQVTPWEVPDDSGENLRLNVWDFGGQELQYSTHEFFLTERAVYVLVFQPRDDLSAPEGLYHWIDLIHTIAPEVPVIVAISKQDEHEGMPNGLADLKEKHPNIVGFFPISCNIHKPEAARFVENARRLRDLIAATVQEEMEHVRYKLPAAWMAVKEQLEEPDNDYLSFAAYQQLCAEKGITDRDDQELLASFLHDLGTMLNYADRIPWEQTHILNPQWVTKGVYAVAIWPKLKETGGIVTDTMICQRLTEPQFEGNFPLEAQRFIMEMMLTFKLCYELPRQGERRFMVPNELREDEPSGEFNAEGALRFEIRFPRIMPTSIISRFIVAMHNQNPQKLWRLGMQGEMLGHTFKVSAHPKERTIRIAIAGHSAARVRVLEIIRNHFSVILREREYEETEYAFAPNHPDASYPFLDLLEAERSGEKTIWLPNSVGRVNLREWLDGITDPQKRKQEQKARAKRGKSGVYIENVEQFSGQIGDTMSESNTNINLENSQFAGTLSGTSGEGHTTTQNATVNQRIAQLAQNPAELKAEIEKLRGLIEQARTAGADEDDCANADEAATVLGEIVEEPEKEGAKRKAKGALAILEGASKGFKSLNEIGQNFEGILKLVGPALGAMLGTQF